MSAESSEYKDNYPTYGVIDPCYARELSKELNANGVYLLILSAYGNIGAGHLSPASYIEYWAKHFGLQYQHIVIDTSRDPFLKLYKLAQKHGVLGIAESVATALPGALMDRMSEKLDRSEQIIYSGKLRDIPQGAPVVICTTHVSGAHTAVQLVNSNHLSDHKVSIVETLPDPVEPDVLRAMRTNLTPQCPHIVVTHDSASAKNYRCITNDHQQAVLPWGTLAHPGHMLGLAANRSEMPTYAVDFAGNPNVRILRLVEEILSTGKRMGLGHTFSVDIHTMNHGDHWQQLTTLAAAHNLAEHVAISCDDHPYNAILGRDARILGLPMPNSTRTWGTRKPGRRWASLGKGERPALVQRTNNKDRDGTYSPYNVIPVGALFGDGHEADIVAACEKLGNFDLRNKPPEMIFGFLNSMHINPPIPPTVADNPLMAIHYAYRTM